MNPFDKLDFKHAFVNRQFLSWRIMLVDLEYFICYFSNSDMESDKKYEYCM